MPSIPVVTINHKDAKILVGNFTNAKGIPEKFVDGLNGILDIKTEKNFTAAVEVDGKMEEKKLFNVIGTIPGR